MLIHTPFPIFDQLLVLGLQMHIFYLTGIIFQHLPLSRLSVLYAPYKGWRKLLSLHVRSDAHHISLCTSPFVLLNSIYMRNTGAENSLLSDNETPTTLLLHPPHGRELITESQNHRVTEPQNRRITESQHGWGWKGPLWVTQSRLHRTLSRRGWNISREGDSTTSLGSLCPDAALVVPQSIFPFLLICSDR